MPDGSVLTPDAAWISDATYETLDRTTTFWRVVPNIVVEIASASDRWETVIAKVERYVQFGARYSIAIDPRTRAVHNAGSPPERFTFHVAPSSTPKSCASVVRSWPHSSSYSIS